MSDSVAALNTIPGKFCSQFKKTLQLWETVRALVRLNIMEGRAPLARSVSVFCISVFC